MRLNPLLIAAVLTMLLGFVLLLIVVRSARAMWSQLVRVTRIVVW